jgi:hypothetical protein
VSEWKIFYTDGSSLAWNAPEILGDVSKIPGHKRVGVHSVIQPMMAWGAPSRECLDEKAFFIYSLRDDMWLDAEHVQLLDLLVHGFANIGCVVYGRWMVTQKYAEMKQLILMDTDIVGEIAPWHEEQCREECYRRFGSVNRNLNLFGEGKSFGWGVRKEAGWQDWTNVARQRSYANSHHYGEYKEYPR